MKKVNIANYVIYDLANRFNNADVTTLNNEIVDLVAETWHKKHFVSSSHGISHHHSERIDHKFII
ncbi:MAG: hypothetical protein IJ864_03325 [Alphaproteobacteria bacterium]|nr:hypothetical protein [Alphaproteobacteria bacterium]